jgi:vitamin B12 transporter
MFYSLSSFGASLSKHARISRRSAFKSTFTLAALAMVAVSAKAVDVRGRVTDALGAPIPGSRVQLVQDGKVVAFGIAGPDGTYEIHYAGDGRYTLVGLSPLYLPSVGYDFYGRANDALQRDVVLATNTVRQDVSVSATGFPTPLPQLTAPVSVIPGDLLALQVGVIDSLRQSPSVFLSQSGQTGAITSLFMRGGPSDGNKVLIDGVPAEDVGGSFDYGTVASTGIGNIEIYRGPNSALYGTDSQTGVVSITTPRGTTSHPQLDYSGDAGSLHTWRNELTAGGTLQKLDYFGGFSRFDTSNAEPHDRYHSGTAVANVGYNFTGNTQVRATVRNADSVEGLPGGYDFYGLATNGREGDQDLYGGVTVENRTSFDWHNLARYGIARKREQAQYFGQAGTLLTFPDPFNPGGTYSGYFGNLVTIRGANGYSATDRAQIYPGAARDQDSNRDELYYQSDYVFPHRVAALFGFRYENERGSSNIPSFFSFQKTQRTNFEYNLQIQGDIKSRFFYSLGGSVQKNHLYGIAGEPRIGFAYVPVRPSSKAFRGTRIRANFAEGVQEPSLAVEFSSLLTELQQAGDTADIAKFHIGPLGPERSRTYDVGVDQNILGEKLALKLGYFHNRFSNQVEYVDSGDIQQFFGIAPTNDPFFFGAELNSQTYRAQGLESEIVYQPKPRLLLRGGYTYLDAVVEKSFSGDVTAVLGGFANQNPNIPGVNIGSSSPLIGARPFRRPPHTGYVSATYFRPKWSVVIKSAMASRSDDSTFLGFVDPGEANTLLLPNRNLDFGYVLLDLGFTRSLKRGFSYFAQVNNLLNDQHIGPIGYPGLPLTFRTGLKLRLGGN